MAGWCVLDGIGKKIEYHFFQFVRIVETVNVLREDVQVKVNLFFAGQ